MSKKEENTKDCPERDLGESFYKYSGIDLSWSWKKCEKCMDCIHSEAHRENRLIDKLQGEVYFSSPLKFNDIIDSQLDVINNCHQLEGKNKLSLKLRELFYKEAENEEDIDLKKLEEELKKSDQKTVEKVRKKQLENIGILCVTKNNTNATMWGYYTDNKGICIEYDTTNLIFDIVIGFTSKMKKGLIDVLKEKRYLEKERDIKERPKRTEFAKEIFNNENEIDKALEGNEYLSDLTPTEKNTLYKIFMLKGYGGKK